MWVLGSAVANLVNGSVMYRLWYLFGICTLSAAPEPPRLLPCRLLKRRQQRQQNESKFKHDYFGRIAISASRIPSFCHCRHRLEDKGQGLLAHRSYHIWTQGTLAGDKLTVCRLDRNTKWPLSCLARLMLCTGLELKWLEGRVPASRPDP